MTKAPYRRKDVLGSRLPGDENPRWQEVRQQAADRGAGAEAGAHISSQSRKQKTRIDTCLSTLKTLPQAAHFLQ